VLLAGFEDAHRKSVLRVSRVTSFRSGRFGEAWRLLEQAAERRRFEEMATAGLVFAELELSEDRRRFGRPRLGPFAPKSGQPLAQLAVARLAVEDSFDHELWRDGSVPVVLLEPEGDVKSLLLAEAVELPSEAEGDRAAGIPGAVLDPEAKVLPVPDGGDLAELAPGHEQGDTGIPEPEGRQTRELCTEVQRQLRAVNKRIDRDSWPELLFRQIRVGVCSKRCRESFNLTGLDRETGRGAVAPEADEVV